MRIPLLSEEHDSILADLDGTLLRGAEPVPGASDALTDSGLSVVYVTNNASRSPEATAAHLRELGFTADASEVMTSAQAAVVLMGDHVPDGAPVLVVGHDSFRDLVSSAGYRVVYSADDEPDAVLQGLSRELTWSDLAEGCLALRRDAVWIASNVDTTLPTERGLLPGNGSLVAALRAATDREPIVAGKPAPGVLAAAAELVGSTRPLVVGDRLDTDIEGAVAAGMASLLVLTGVHGIRDLVSAPAHRRPTHLARDLVALGEPDSSSRIGSAPEIDADLRDGRLVIDRVADGLRDVDLARAVIRRVWRHGVTSVTAVGDSTRAQLAAAGLDVG